MGFVNHERPGAATPVPAITRAAAILGALGEKPREPLTISELARRLGYPKSSTANLCVALEQVGWLQRSGDGGYQLGRTLAELGGKYLSTVDEISVFHSVCRNSRYLCKETARVALLDGLEVVYLARFDGDQPLRLTANVGDRYPATSTATGKALLATLAPDVLSDRLSQLRFLPRLTEHSITTMTELMEEIERTRTRGWAIDDEESHIGITCVAVAVPAPAGQPSHFAVSATILKARLTPELKAGLLEDLRRVATAMQSPETLLTTDGLRPMT